MNHEEAARLSLVEKYLLEELPPDLRDEFEDHYFECQECTADLRATAAFLDTAKEELKSFPAENSATAPVRKPWFSWLWSPAFVVPALAACLLVIAYQNIVIFPHFRNALAEMRAPEILPTLSLVGGNSRSGAAAPSLEAQNTQPFLVLVDIPTQERFASYTCLLYSPSGSLAWRVQVSAEAAKDTVSIRVPPGQRAAGSYTLAVQGNTGPAPAENGVDLARYHFTLSSQK
jgi:Putative zinc-finger